MLERQFIVAKPQDRNQVSLYVANMRSSPTMVVDIKPYVPQRTNQANKYYWGVVLKTLADYTGYDEEVLHTFFKEKFLSPEDLTVFEEKVRVYPTTTKLNNKQFGEYLDKITRFAADNLGCYFPTNGDY